MSDTSPIEITQDIRRALQRIGQGVEVSTTNALTQGLTPFAIHKLQKAGLANKVPPGHQVRLTLKGFEVAMDELIRLGGGNPNDLSVVAAEVRRNYVIAQRRAGINVEYETPQSDSVQAPEWMVPGSDEDEAIINAVRDLPLIQRDERPANIRAHVHAILKIVKLSA